MMNGQYVHPPPGLYIQTSGNHYGSPLPSPQSAYPPYHYPQPLSPSHYQMPPPAHTFAQSPHHYSLYQNGYHGGPQPGFGHPEQLNYSAHPYSNGNGHFPEPPAPAPPPNITVQSPGLTPTNGAVPSSSKTDDPDVHGYWRGRIAPLPGFRSKGVLLPMKRFEEKVENNQKKDEENPELLPPASFFGKGYKRSSKILDGKTDPQENTKKDFQFDKFADSFVPQYLKRIQQSLHPLKPLPALPVFPPESYLHSFLVQSLIRPPQKSNAALHSLLSFSPLSGPVKLPNLEIATYKQHWEALLRWELDALTKKKEQIVLWQTPIKVAVWKEAEFALEVPGIRENHPYLEVGDLVHMREVLEAEKTGSNRAIEGRVVSLRKREGLVYIKSQPLREHIWAFVPFTPKTKTEDGWAAYGPDDVFHLRFNLTFMMNPRPLCLMENAVYAVSKILDTNISKGTNLARQWVFPEPEDFLNAPSMKLENGKIQDDQWVDKGLNDEQRLAVTSVALYQLPVPHLISGPPGTGKTKTIVEAVLQVLRAQPEATILVCAPSNPATDTLALRLHKELKQHEMLRLNDPNRTFAEVPDEIKPFCYIENNTFSIPPWKKLMEYRVVVTSCLDASILVNAQCTNTMLMTLEEQVMASLHPHKRSKHVVQPHWTHLLIDEAAQGSEPELLIPISVVLPQVYNEQAAGKTFMPQLALCGDINQLGPIVTSEEARSAELEVSLLERLFERRLYVGFDQLQKQQQKWKESFASRVSHNGITKGKTVQANGSANADTNGAVPNPSQRLPPYTHLVKNYRSHPAILMPPSAIFYNDSLEPCANNGTVSWTGLAVPELPLKFVGDMSPEDSMDERASWFNPGQITAVVEVVKSILAERKKCTPALKVEEIGIMAPWREQVWKLRERLRKENLGAVDVGTVEDYQGRESRVIIISCVRSNPRFLDEDCKKGLGFVFERKRMNVAITRAKELLVVIGNPQLLLKDPYWKSFLQFAKRNKLYAGPDLVGLEMDGNYISKLESDLILSCQNGLEAEEQGVATAGAVAREILRE